MPNHTVPWVLQRIGWQVCTAKCAVWSLVLALGCLHSMLRTLGQSPARASKAMSAKHACACNPIADLHEDLNTHPLSDQSDWTRKHPEPPVASRRSSLGVIIPSSMPAAVIHRRSISATTCAPRFTHGRPTIWCPSIAERWLDGEPCTWLPVCTCASARLRLRRH